MKVWTMGHVTFIVVARERIGYKVGDMFSETFATREAAYATAARAARARARQRGRVRGQLRLARGRGKRKRSPRQGLALTGAKPIGQRDARPRFMGRDRGKPLYRAQVVDETG